VSDSEAIRSVHTPPSKPSIPSGSRHAPRAPELPEIPTSRGITDEDWRRIEARIAPILRD